MASKIFLDANLLLDITLKREGYTPARALMEIALEGKLYLYTTPSVLHITAYFTSQSYSIRETRMILLTLLNDIQIIDADYDTVLAAISNTDWSDIEDAIQYYTALHHNLDFFISADKKLKKSAIPQLPILSSIEILKRLNK